MSMMEVCTFVGVVDSRAFLQLDRVTDVMQDLVDNISEYAGPDGVIGTYRRAAAVADDEGDVPPVDMRYVPPQFTPYLLTLDDRILEC